MFHQPTSYHTVVKGQRIDLIQDPDYVAVRYRDEIKHSGRLMASSHEALGSFSNRIEPPHALHAKYTILPVAQTGQLRIQRFMSACNALKPNDNVVRTNPVFKTGDTKLVPTDEILLKFSDENARICFTEEYAADLKMRPLHPETFEYVLQLPAEKDVLEESQALSERPNIVYARPNFLIIGPRLPRSVAGNIPIDPQEKHQYALEITKARQAWDLQRGDKDIVIAIIDEGVDTQHEDLKAAIHPLSYDAIDDDSFQEPLSGDGHGTSCAGLAAGVHGNSVGMKGIGGGCSIMAIRIACSRPGETWTTDEQIVKGIDFAWKNGADILSNSWGGGAPNDAVIDAFQRAKTYGRNGKGCVIVVAAGNESRPVSFPANLPDVLGVSATNEFDEFKTKRSRDGEQFWGSNFGPEIDISAPGVHNLTTDITGSAGYDPGNYYSFFNGTSSATPIVAGAAGLVLSSNRDLTGEQVHQILKSTADKIGPGRYARGRNDYFGYGRLNVLKAVEAAIASKSAPLSSLLSSATPRTNMRRSRSE
jgi:subtilisin family serine protease